MFALLRGSQGPAGASQGEALRLRGRSVLLDGVVFGVCAVALFPASVIQICFHSFGASCEDAAPLDRVKRYRSAHSVLVGSVGPTVCRSTPWTCHVAYFPSLGRRWVRGTFPLLRHPVGFRVLRVRQRLFWRVNGLLSSSVTSYNLRGLFLHSGNHSLRLSD